MLPNHDEFVDAIHNRKQVRVSFRSKKDDYAPRSRRCAPTDYGPAKTTNAPESRYHLWDFEGGDGAGHTLILPESQIIKIEVLESTFDPAAFITWPTDWHVPRTTWGAYC